MQALSYKLRDHAATDLQNRLLCARAYDRTRTHAAFHTHQRDCLLNFWCMLRAQAVRLAPLLATPKRLRKRRCCIRCGVGHCVRCGWSQPFIPSGVRSFSARSARPSAGFCALEVADRRERACTVECRHVSHVDVHRTSMWGDIFCVCM